MSEIPLVSITIPSYNAEKTIGLCLDATRKQTYPNIEIIVVDSHSKDKTRDISASFGAKVINCDGKLLAARYIGLKESKGCYVVLVDTDQVLKSDTIERAVNLMDRYDMLVFEEESYNKEWFIPKLYSASKKVINQRFDKSYAFDPVKGGNPARFFRREVLEKAFGRIPQELIPNTIHYDHDIIYYEAYQVSQRVGILRGAVFHIEPDFKKLWRTNIRYGASLRTVENSHYWELFLKKRGSGFWFTGFGITSLQAFCLSLILKLVQWIGYHFYKTRLEL
jgi:glycosyltransferase involved in cell wall biosynthesis